MVQENNPYCELWNGTFTEVFHGASLIFGVAFSVPQNFEQSFLVLRMLLNVALFIMVFWSLNTVCKAPDLFLWNSAFTLINLIYVFALIKKHFPTFIPSYLMNYYTVVLKPLLVSQKDFMVLIRDAQKTELIRGHLFCQEHRSTVEKKLNILLSGMMTVRCDGLFLQAIQPNEFIDSVEWKSRQYGQPFPTHQVTIEAITDCTILQIDEESLEKAFDSAPHLRMVLDCLIGRDVTRKLYSVSDVTNMGSNSNAQHQNNQMNQTPGRPLRVLNFRKTASMDAIHTGSKGNVRSDPWIKDANLKQFQNDEQVVLVNFELDVPPSMEYLPHQIPVQVLDKDVMAEAQFLAQQRKYWPSGFL